MEILKKCAIFNGIEEPAILLKHIYSSIKKYKKYEYIYSVNDTIECMCIVLNGVVDIEKEDYWGNRHIIDRVHSGEMFGESIAFSKNRKMFVNVIASRTSEIMFLNYKDIMEAYKKSPEQYSLLIYNLMNIIASKNVMLVNKMEHICKRTIRDKILSYLSEQVLINESNRFSINFNRQELSEYLSVDRSALSTVLHNLKKDGYIDFDKNTFELKDKLK